MKNWFLWLIIGILSIVAGIVALMNPFAATLTAHLMAGYFFMIIGILTVFSAFQDQGWGARIWAILLGVVITLLGINLIANPLQGILALTLVVGILMLTTGVFRLVMAFSPRAANVRLPLIASGALSIILAMMIFSGFPASGLVVLGILLAVELISNGVSMVFVALSRRSEEAPA